VTWVVRLSRYKGGESGSYYITYSEHIIYYLLLPVTMATMRYAIVSRIPIDSPSVYSPYSCHHGDTMASVELSSAVYSPTPEQRQKSPTPITLSYVSSIDGTRNAQPTTRGPVNSTFNSPLQLQTCVRTLTYVLDLELTTDTISGATSSSGYSSAVVSSSEEISVTTAHPNSSDSAIYGCVGLGPRPQCIGQESSHAHHLVNKLTIDASMMSTASDMSFFMEAPMNRPSVTAAKSKGSHKSIARKLKLFRKQLRHLGRSSECHLKSF